MSKIHEAIRSRNMNLLIQAIESGEELIFDDKDWGMKRHALDECIYAKLDNGAYFTNVEAARILLSHPLTRDKIDLNREESAAMYCSAMFCAAKSDNVELLNLFYSFGGNIDVKRTQGEKKEVYISTCLMGATPLYATLVGKARRTARRLIELGADTTCVKELIYTRLEECRVKSNEENIKASYAVHLEKEKDRLRRYSDILNDAKANAYH